MTVLKSGDLVVLKSGGPTMTVDSVNTSIFDDDKITGVVCVWFVGQKLERVRFEHEALQLASPQQASHEMPQGELCPETTEAYKVVLDNMVGAMNTPRDHDEHVETAKAAPKRQRGTVRIGTEIPKNTH